MTINKFIKADSPYQTTSRETVNKLTDIDQLAIWTYLMHRPTDWAPQAKQIREHFGIGHDRYKKALRGLREAGLASWTQERGENGRITGSIFHLVFRAPSQRASENEST